MVRFCTRLTLVLVSLLQFSTFVSAGPLDDYYLQQFGEASSSRLQKAILSVSADVQESAHCGMPLKRGLRRDWKLLEQTTQKVLAKQLALPALSNEQSVVSSGGHFKVHFTDVAPDAPKVSLINIWPGLSNITTSADWARQVAETFEQVYTTYASSNYNYRLVPFPLNNPSGPYDIYLQELSGRRLYGFTEQPTLADGITIDPNYWVGQPFPNSVSSYIVLDNDFVESMFTSSHGATYSPLQSLQITAAHEYHHAIQFGYNYFFDVWYAEATSTWMEDELYDGVNQLYNYIPAWFNQSKLSLDTPASISTGGGYGRWIFNRYLAENHTTAVVRSFWEKLAGIASTNGQDISMTLVLDSVLSTSYNSSLSAEFFKFAKRVYVRDWPITPTITSADISLIPTYSPVATYTVYPVNSNSNPKPSVSLPHYSFAYYRLVNSPGVTSLKITISNTPGIQTALFKNAAGEIAADANGTSYSVSSFVNTDELILLIANTTSNDGENANFSTDGTTVPSTPMPVVSGSSNHCFIATAAYGSYLHPQVQLLRNFRDEYLLTNAPGRAFVAFYYRHSPPLADFISRHSVLRGVTRLALTPVVAAIAHPLISAVFLFLLAGALLVSLLRRIKTARLNANPCLILTTKSR